MDRRHLRGEDRVGLPHFLGKDLLLDGRGADRPLLRMLLPDPDRCDEGAHADAGGAQIIDLVDLQTGIDLSAAGEDLLHLVGGHRVEAAAEGVELDEIQILALLDEVRGRVEPGVVHPLVVDPQRALELRQFGDRVLGQHRHSVAVDQLRNAVVDLRVDMVGPAGQHDAVPSGLREIVQGLDALRGDIRPYGSELLPGFCGCTADLLLRKLLKDLHHARREDLLI